MAYTTDDIEIEGPAAHTMLALQIFVPRESARFHPALLGALRNSENEPFAPDKARFWREVTALLSGAVTDAHFGVWDYIDDDEAALEEYQQWCDGTIEDAAEAKPPAPGIPSYLFVTVLLLCDAGAAADEQLREATESIEDDPWTVSSFQMLLSAISALDWRAVKSDTLFVRPGQTGFGVSADLLQEEQYHYLHPLV